MLAKHQQGVRAMTHRGIILYFTLLTMLLTSGSLLADESRTLLVHDEHGAFLQVDTHPSEVSASAAEMPVLFIVTEKQIVLF